MDTAVYLYAVVNASTRLRAGRAPKGPPGSTPPTAVQVSASLWLVVSQVPLDLYGPEPLQAALRDMQWVADAALAHEAVVEHFSRTKGSTAIPMKLFTMFSTLDRALGEMRSRRR